MAGNGGFDPKEFSAVNEASESYNGKEKKEELYKKGRRLSIMGEKEEALKISKELFNLDEDYVPLYVLRLRIHSGNYKDYTGEAIEGDLAALDDLLDGSITYIRDREKESIGKREGEKTKEITEKAETAKKEYEDRIASLTKELEKAKTTIDSLSKEKDDLEVNTQSYKEKAESFEQKVSSLEEEREAYRRKEEEAKRENASLKEENKELSNKMNASNTNVQALEQKIAALEKELAVYHKKDEEAKKEQQKQEEAKSSFAYKLKNIKKGSTIEFGRFPQGKNGEAEPLAWRVLKVKDGKALLITDKCLGPVQYFKDTNDRTINGKTVYPNNYMYSNLRAWLNSLDGSDYGANDYGSIGFYDAAFTDEEKRIISETLVDNSASTTDSSSNRYACSNTRDRVFALSYQEANSLFDSDNSRQAKPTTHSLSQGAYQDGGNAWWWLRSPDSGYSDCVNDVYADGTVDWRYVNNENFCVRPALWIDLSEIS